MMKKSIYEVYSSENDLTTIFEDVLSDDGESVSSELKGFYYGKPNEEDTKTYYGILKCEY